LRAFGGAKGLEVEEVEGITPCKTVRLCRTEGPLGRQAGRAANITGGRLAQKGGCRTGGNGGLR